MATKTRICKSCKKDLPLIADNFYYLAKKDRFNLACKCCMRRKATMVLIEKNAKAVNERNFNTNPRKTFVISDNVPKITSEFDRVLAYYEPK